MSPIFTRASSAAIALPPSTAAVMGASTSSGQRLRAKRYLPAARRPYRPEAVRRRAGADRRLVPGAFGVPVEAGEPRRVLRVGAEHDFAVLAEPLRHVGPPCLVACPQIGDHVGVFRGDVAGLAGVRLDVVQLRSAHQTPPLRHHGCVPLHGRIVTLAVLDEQRPVGPALGGSAQQTCDTDAVELDIPDALQMAQIDQGGE